MAGNGNEIEKRLWEAADELRANSKLKSSEYSVPVLGLIFLRYADTKFAEAERQITGLPIKAVDAHHVAEPPPTYTVDTPSAGHSVETPYRACSRTPY